MKSFSKSKTKASQAIKHTGVINHQVFGHKMQKNAFYKSKKAVVEVQFGWIFVMIVGILILLFFVSVVKTTGKSSTVIKNEDLKTNIKSIISQSELDVGTTRTIGMPAITLTFDCEGFNIEDSKSPFLYKTIFSPDVVKGREMITYSKYFEMPFKVDYFVYITSKQIRYNFINDTSCQTNPKCQTLLGSIIKELPANITYQVVNTVNEVTDNNYYKERFILFGGSATALPGDTNSSLKNTDVTAIRIIPDSAQESGNITYYNKTKDAITFIKKSSSNYLGIPMLLGAIISEETLYVCNVNKTLQKFKILSSIYSDRASYLETYYSIYIDNTCKTHYSNINDSLHEITNSLSSSSPFSKFSDIYSLALSPTGLSGTNYYLMLESCPLIY